MAKLPSVAPNTYCERLGVPVPDLDEVLDRKQMKLFHAVIVALLERGGPMKLDELVERLLDADVYSPIGDMATSIMKAWHGLPPVVKDRDGRYALDPEAEELRWLLHELGVKERAAPRVEPPKPEIVQPGDEAPLTKEELDAALDKAGLLRGLDPFGEWPPSWTLTGVPCRSSRSWRSSSDWAGSRGSTVSRA